MYILSLESEMRPKHKVQGTKLLNYERVIHSNACRFGHFGYLGTLCRRDK